MKNRIAATLGLTALALGLVAVPASADLTALESYGAGSTASALNITLLGQDATFSVTGAEVDSAPQAQADGFSVVSPAFTSDGAPSQQPGGAESGEDCALEFDPEEVFGTPSASVVTIDVACVRTEASADGGLFAGATSDEIVIEVSLAMLEEDQLDPILDPISDGIGQIIDGLQPILGPIDDSDLNTELSALLLSIRDALLDGETVLRVTVAPTTSTAAAGEDSVEGSAFSEGAVIEVFPDLPGGTLATVTVGTSGASVARTSDGSATTDAEAAVVTVEGSPQLGAVSDALQQISEGLGELSAASLPCNADDNPLFDLVCLELGTTAELTQDELEALNLDFGEGTVGIRASAARVQVLSALQEQLEGPGVGISLADTAAAANVIAAEPAPPVTEPPVTEAPVVTEPPTPPVDPPADPETERTTLPQTGASVPVGFAAALAGLAALGLIVVRRSSTP
jgi:LPXTG-motif cell wall-anchored protein